MPLAGRLLMTCTCQVMRVQMCNAPLYPDLEFAQARQPELESCTDKRAKPLHGCTQVLRRRA